MNWSLIGKIVGREIPKVLERVEDHRAARTRDDKKEAARTDLTTFMQEIKFIRGGKDLSKDPRVVAAVGKVTDAYVEFQNDLALVEAELAAPPTL